MQTALFARGNLASFVAAVIIAAGLLSTESAAQKKTTGNIEPVVLFDKLEFMPTQPAISHSGRVFVNSPRRGEPLEFTVAEVIDGKLVPYPNAEINRFDNRSRDNFIAVFSLVIDAKDRLWILDTGSISRKPLKPGSAKLIGVDLSTNRIVKTIRFPSNVALPTTNLNDIRIDIRRGLDGMAFITDAANTGSGPNGIIVVDLATGSSWRKLSGHPSTRAEQNFVFSMEGQPLKVRQAFGPEAYLDIGSDGIALTPNGKTLYYTPISGRGLYSVSVDALVERNLSEAQTAATVKNLGERDFVSDGIECDLQGRLYLSDLEHNCIKRRTSEGRYETVACDPRMIWTDSLTFGPDGYLYFTASQLNRQPGYNKGKDLRQPPYALFRVLVDAQPSVRPCRSAAPCVVGKI